MDIKTVKEICQMMCDQLAFQASNTFQKTGELHNEEQQISDLLDEIANYEHKKEG